MLAEGCYWSSPGGLPVAPPALIRAGEYKFEKKNTKGTTGAMADGLPLRRLLSKHSDPLPRGYRDVALFHLYID